MAIGGGRPIDDRPILPRRVELYPELFDEQRDERCIGFLEHGSRGRDVRMCIRDTIEGVCDAR